MMFKQFKAEKKIYMNKIYFEHQETSPLNK